MLADSFRPLYALVRLAVQPLLGLRATQATGPSGLAFNGITTARYPFETARDRHQLAPEGQMAFVQVPWNPAHEPFEPRPVFEVAYVDAYSYVWVAKNSHSRSMPPPPDRNGPVMCVCGAPRSVGVAPRYLAETGGGSWFCPDVHSDRVPARAFSPDLFAGAGPCAARDDPGFLSQWDSAWVEPTDEGDWSFTEHFHNHVTVVETADLTIARAVQVAVHELDVPQGPEHASAEDLRRCWSTYAISVQRRRAVLLEAVIAQGYWRKLRDSNDPAWVELRSERLLATGCIGAWFKEPLAHLDVLLDYFRKGLPVFYPWSDELGRRAPELAPSCELREVMRPLYEHLLPAPRPPLPTHTAHAGAQREHTPAPPTPGPSQPAPAAEPSAPSDSSTFPDDGSVTDEVWDSWARELDNQQGAREPSPASEQPSPTQAEMPPPPTQVEMPPPPYRPVPFEGRDFFLAPCAQLHTQDMSDYHVVPCSRADSYISRLVESETEFLANAGRPRRRATTNAAALVLPELLQRMNPAPPPALADNVYLIVYDWGLVTRALDYALQHGLVSNRTELVDFLIDNGIQFKSGIQVANTEPLLTAHWHEVPEGPWFDENAPVPVQFEQWTLHLFGILGKPHVARATQARGGVLSLAARAIADPRFPLQPTRPTLEHGSPHPAPYRDITIYDDYLTDAEVKLILGYPHARSERSLLPSLKAFNEVYAGVITRGIADWFQARMHELRTGFQGRTGSVAEGARTGSDWRRALRNELRNWYEPRPSLDGGAL